VQIAFERKGDQYCLKVSDDGAGVKEEAAASTGQRLVRSLTLQLRGRYEIAPGNPGTVCRVEFPVAEG
jgi:two-component sensor histidine kinase